MNIGYSSIKLDIVSKEFSGNIFEFVSNVVYVEDEEKGTNDTTLRDTTGD